MKIITLFGLFGAVCLITVAAIIGSLRNEDERKKCMLARLKLHYSHIREERRDFERDHANKYVSYSDPEYQTLLRREAGAIMYITALFPEEEENLNIKLEFLMIKINDSIPQ